MQDNLVADFSGALDVAALLHVIHNATNDLAAVMPEYSEQVGRLCHISKMLTKREARQRLFNTCHTYPVGQQLRKDIATFLSPVNTGRWGTAAKAVEEIGPLQRPLQWGWSLSKFEHGKKENR